MAETQEMRMTVGDHLGWKDLPHPQQGQPTAQAWSRRGAALGPCLVLEWMTPVVQARRPGSRAKDTAGSHWGWPIHSHVLYIGEVQIWKSREEDKPAVLI